MNDYIPGLQGEGSWLHAKLKRLLCSSLFNLVRGVGFEPTNSKRADLQSAVFDRFTNPAY
jgi:hypothetical protein